MGEADDDIGAEGEVRARTWDSSEKGFLGGDMKWSLVSRWVGLEWGM